MKLLNSLRVFLRKSLKDLSIWYIKRYGYHVTDKKSLYEWQINPDYKTLNSFNIKKIKEKKLKIYPWTVNEIDNINMMIDFQVDGIITDYPDRIPKPIN